MNANVISIMRSGAALIRQNMQGKKRWISLVIYLLLALSAFFGFELTDLSKKIALDPNLEQDGTLLALALAAGTTFRFFQTMGRNRKLDEEVAEIRERMDRNGVS